MISARLARAKRGRTTNIARANLEDPKVWQELTGREESAGRGQEAPGRRTAAEERERGGEAPRRRGRLPRRQARSGNIPMKIAYQLTFAIAALPQPLLVAGGGADGSAQREMPLLEGRGELLQFERDIQKVAVAEPKDRRRDRDLAARGDGECQIAGAHHRHHLGDGRRCRRATTSTSPATPPNSTISRRQIQDSAAGSPHQRHRHGETVVLTGSVKSAGRIQAAGQPGADARQDRDQPAAGAAAAGTAADSAAGEVRRRGPRGAVAGGLQPVQHAIPSCWGESSTQQFQSPRFSQLQPGRESSTPRSISPTCSTCSRSGPI